MQLEQINITCDFCGKEKSFKNMNQVSLRIDKQKAHQYLFAWMCSDCSNKNIKKTSSGQKVKDSFKNYDEQSDFSSPDEKNI
jgi:hypothetical protein